MLKIGDRVKIKEGNVSKYILPDVVGFVQEPTEIEDIIHHNNKIGYKLKGCFYLCLEDDLILVENDEK